MKYPLDWLVWCALILSKGQLGYSGSTQHQDQRHHGWSAIFSPNVMWFDDIHQSPSNVKELSNSPMKRPPEADDTEHFVLKFQDLPPWRPKKASKSDKRRREGDSVILDLRPYNPLTSHFLTQSYVYPASNGLTQTDRDYFAMIQSETGLSEVHFEASSHELGTTIEAPEARTKIKEPKQLAGASSQCQKPGCGEQASKQGQSDAEKTTTTTKPIPRFAYHRVPGSFASFRVIRPAYPDSDAAHAAATMPSFDSFHDDEPPNSLQRPQRDVAAVHLVQ